MSANDILDVLNIQRDESSQPPKKKQKASSTPTLPDGKQLTGMARELYNLVGPNTPPISLNSNSYAANKEKLKKFKPSPWTKMPFKPKSGIELNHWVKGSKELLEQQEQEEEGKPYFFDKFNVRLEIPNFVDEETFEKYMEEIKEYEEKLRVEKEARDKNEQSKSKVETKNDDKEKPSETKEKVTENPTEKKDTNTSQTEPSKSSEETEKKGDEKDDEKEEETDQEWTYKETKLLFELCQAFELKWPIIYDRFPNPNRSAEDLKEQFYRICIKILENQEHRNQPLIDSLKAYSKPRELERKQYLENLLKRTPAEIAEEESLVIEARRFELAAKKMLMERSNLLTLLDSPQSTQNVSQYQSSQGITNLYNNLLIYDKHQKKKMANKAPPQDPVPPPIPLVASSSIKRDRGFQTHLQQYLSSLLKQNHHTNPALKQESNSIQQLLMKRLTQKEEEAYGLHYHGTEKLTPGVMLRSQQKLPGLNQRQSILKSVNMILQEMDVPTGGGTSWKPIMPTRKTMAKYDELIRSVVTLLDVKKAKDKLESEIKLVKSQRGL
ncbi:SWC4 SWR1-complex protein 4 [Candida maltosa Xu316]